MGQMVVRNIDDEALERFKRKAAAANKSAEAFARELIHAASRPSKEHAWAELDRIRAMSKPSEENSTAVIRALRDGDDDTDY